MTIRFHCPNERCRKRLKADDTLAGRPTRCTRCRSPFTVPLATEPVATPGKESDHPWFADLASVTDAAPTAIATPVDRGPSMSRAPVLARLENDPPRVRPAMPTPPPLPFTFQSEPPRSRRTAARRKPAGKAAPSDVELLEARFRSNSRWAGGVAFVLGALLFFIAVGTAASDSPDLSRGASVLLGLIGGTLTGLGALTWSRRVLAIKFLFAIVAVWICAQIGAAIYLIGFASGPGSTIAGPGLGFLLSGWLIQLCGKALDAASRLNRDHQQQTTRGRVPWVGLGLTATSLLAVGMFTALRQSPTDWGRLETMASTGGGSEAGHSKSGDVRDVTTGTGNLAQILPPVLPDTTATGAQPRTVTTVSLPTPAPVVPRETGSPPIIPNPAPPVVKKDPPKTPSPKTGVATPVRLSDLKFDKATQDPATVTFTIRVDLGGAELLEAWASVDVPDPGELLKVFAGAIYQGLLSLTIDGMTIDFANPPPSLKAQRVSLKKSAADPMVYVGEVKFPKVKVPESTTFGLLLAARSGDKVIHSNAVIARVNMKTGKAEAGTK